MILGVFHSPVLFLILVFILSACTQPLSQSTNLDNPRKESPVPFSTNDISTEEIFTGIKGDLLTFTNGQISLPIQNFIDNQAQYYHAQVNGKTVYFFVVKDKNGIYRAAANACQICHQANMGFSQVGNYMKCNTCGNQYPLEKIATQKGGCNPIPINPNLEVKDNRLIINQIEFSDAAYYF